MKRRILSLFLTIALIGAAVFSTAVSSSAWTFGNGADFKGSDCVTNANASATIDYLMSKYKDGSTWTLGGECWGFAEKVNEFLAAANQTDYYSLKNTQKNFLDKCKDVYAGTHIRFSNQKEFSSWVGHSVVILEIKDDIMYWADNNYDRANTVHYYSGTIDDFYMMYGQYSYINMIKQPTKYKTYKTAKISSRGDYGAGGIRLTWLRTTSTEKYEILRSYTKKGSYKKVGTTTKQTFMDTSIDMGRTAYYKIRSVRKSGSTTSGYVYNTLRLKAPTVTVTNTGDDSLLVSWNTIEKADRYKLYRSIDGGKEKLIKTTTSSSYTERIADTDSVYTYRVKAVWDKTDNGNSPYSKPASGRKGLSTPTGLSGITDENNHLTLTWNPVSGADVYYLYCTREEYGPDGTYWIEATLDGSQTSYFDTVRLPGQKYYYKIAAYDWDTGMESAASPWILI